MPAVDGAKSFDEFRNSEEGKQPASPEFEASMTGASADGQQGGGDTASGGTSTGAEPASPANESHAVPPAGKQGETKEGEQEGTESSARSKEDRERQLRALSVEEEKLDTDIIEKKQRIQEKRAARRAMLDAAKDEGLFQRDGTRPIAAKETPGEPDDPDRPLTRKEMDEAMFNRDANFQLQTFLGEHPEYTPEKDPYNEKWDSLQSAIKKYKAPTDPAEMRQVLEWAHTDVTRSSTPPPSASKADQDAAAKARLAQAGHGASGSAKGGGMGSGTSPDPAKVQYLMQGGFSKEEATRIVQRASRR